MLSSFQGAQGGSYSSTSGGLNIVPTVDLDMRVVVKIRVPFLGVHIKGGIDIDVDIATRGDLSLGVVKQTLRRRSDVNGVLTWRTAPNKGIDRTVRLTPMRWSWFGFAGFWGKVHVGAGCRLTLVSN